MQNKSHSFWQILDSMQEQELMVMRHISDFSFSKDYYMSEHLFVCMNHRGFARFAYDNLSVDFQPHQILFIFPGHLLKEYESSDDFDATVVVISTDLLKVLRRLHPFHYRVECQNQTTFLLDKDVFNIINNGFRLIERINRMESPDRVNLLIAQMDVIARLLEIYLGKGDRMKLEMESPEHRLMDSFYDEIVKHYRQNREVKFYAGLLHLSPKYFGSVVRRSTGVSANEWIARYVITQAKHLLRHFPNLTVQQISEQLGFDDQTAFARYFKSHTHMTPTEYRNGELSVK